METPMDLTKKHQEGTGSEVSFRPDNLKRRWNTEIFQEEEEGEDVPESYKESPESPQKRGKVQQRFYFSMNFLIKKFLI